MTYSLLENQINRTDWYVRAFNDVLTRNGEI